MQHQPSSTRLASRIAGGTAVAALAAGTNLLLARRAEAASPPQGRFVTVQGVRIHVQAEGSGPPIVLLHGNGATSDDFAVSGLTAILARHNQVFAFDRPGFGHSERPDDRDWTPEAQATLLAEAADALGIVNPVVVGHSLGTLVALAWAQQRPADVAAVGLLAGYYFPTGRPDSRLQKLLSLPGLAPLAAWTLLPLQARLSWPLAERFIFGPAPVTEAFKTRTPTALIRRPSQLRATSEDGAGLPAAAERLSARYERLTMPVLLAWGEGDRMVHQKRQSARLARLLPHATTLCLSKVGHMVHHSAPQAVARAIVALTQEAAPLQRQLPDLPLRAIEANGAAVPLGGVR